MKKLAILGAGDMGKQALQIALEQNKYEPVGFFDDFNKDTEFETLPIFGNTDSIVNAYQANVFDLLFIAVGYKHMARKYDLIVNKFNNIPFATLIHPTAIIDPKAIVEEGVIIYPKAFIGPDVRVCKGAVINVGTLLPHDNVISSCAFISVGVAFGGKTNIGTRSFVGVGSSLSDNISISEDIIVGVGSVVIKNLLENGTYVGIPAKKIK